MIIHQANTKQKLHMIWKLPLFRLAQRFSTNELVQSIEIISDNPQKPVSDFDKSQIRSLIQPSLKLIENLTEEMIVCSDEITRPVENEKIFSEIAQVHHFSETQHYQLKKPFTPCPNLRYAFK